MRSVYGSLRYMKINGFVVISDKMHGLDSPGGNLVGEKYFITSRIIQGVVNIVFYNGVNL
jgi:hypothetical protein